MLLISFGLSKINFPVVRDTIDKLVKLLEELLSNLFDILEAVSNTSKREEIKMSPYFVETYLAMLTKLTRALMLECSAIV